MRGVWTPEEIRAAEQRLFESVPESVVMRRAAYAVAVRTAHLLTRSTGGVSGRHVTLFVGAGNNGGDALWAGHYLRQRGVGVSAILLAPEKAHAAGLAALRRSGGRAVAATGVGADTAGVGAAAVDALERADVVIDGIVGLSARGPLRPVAAELVQRVDVPVVSVDLPSGVDPVTGAAAGAAVRADVTVTFGGLKPCHLLDAAAVCSGEVVVADIGLDDHLGEPDLAVLDPDEVGAGWPVPSPADDKYSQGVTGIVAGSAVFPGAAVLACGAAVHATSGMVRYAGPAADLVRSHWPEVVGTGSITDAGRVQAWAIGPGIGTGSNGRDVLTRVLESGLPVCADADAITLLAENPSLWDARDPDAPLVLTPHAGEFARIAGELGEDRVSAVRSAARRFNAVVLLKGHATVVAEPGGRVLINSSPQAWPATAGSGDVLTGLIGALLSSEIDPLAACGYAAHVHALAAEIAACGGGAAGAPIGASALLAAVPHAIREVRAEPALESPN